MKAGLRAFNPTPGARGRTWTGTQALTLSSLPPTAGDPPESAADVREIGDLAGMPPLSGPPPSGSTTFVTHKPAGVLPLQCGRSPPPSQATAWNCCGTIATPPTGSASPVWRHVTREHTHTRTGTTNGPGTGVLLSADVRAAQVGRDTATPGAHNVPAQSGAGGASRTFHVPSPEEIDNCAACRAGAGLVCGFQGG